MTIEGDPERGLEVFGSSLSGGAEPLFTMPNTSQSLAAAMAVDEKREGRGKMRKQNKWRNKQNRNGGPENPSL